jgi:hypothetical protein
MSSGLRVMVRQARRRERVMLELHLKRKRGRKKERREGERDYKDSNLLIEKGLSYLTELS